MIHDDLSESLQPEAEISLSGTIERDDGRACRSARLAP